MKEAHSEGCSHPQTSHGWIIRMYVLRMDEHGTSEGGPWTKYTDDYLCIKHKYGWIIIDVIWWTWYIIERLLYAPTTHSSTTGMNTCRWIGQMDVLIRDVQSTSSRGSLINALNISFSRPSFGKNLLVLVHSMLAQQFSRVEARRGSFSTEVTRRPPVLRERIIFLI